MDPSKFDNLKWGECKADDRYLDTENLEWVHPTDKDIWEATECHNLHVCYFTVNKNVEDSSEALLFLPREDIFFKDDAFVAVKSIAYHYACYLGLNDEIFFEKIFKSKNSVQIDNIENRFVLSHVISATDLFNLLQTLMVPSENYKKINTSKISGIIETINSLCPNEKKYLFDELGIVNEEKLRRQYELERDFAVARAREDAKAVKEEELSGLYYLHSNIALLNGTIMS